MDLYRPIFHFMPENNWMNDPNGPIFYKGEYHLFYQYNPNGFEWGTIHWGHAKSKDLVHWEHLPIALYPSNELGEDHCFSGCAVVNDEGVPTLFYTSIGSGDRHQTVGAEQWMATSSDDMITWDKHTGNPVVSLQHHGEMDIREWRDPFVWKEGEQWLMVVGGAHNNKGCALIYGSTDLTEWKFLNKLMEAKVESEEIWECPNLFKLGDKHVLIYSPSDVVKYYTGTLNSDYTFTPEYHGTIDHSGWEGFYAPNSIEDGQGRRIMWGWMTENARGDFEVGEGWAGVQSLPRILSLQENGRLKIEAAPELQMLRENHEQMDNLQLDGDQVTIASKGRALEIIAEFELLDPSASFGIKVLQSERGEEETVVVFEPSAQRFTVDRSKASLSSLTHRTELSGQMDIKQGETVKVHLFLDHSLIEVFANDEECISTRVYPTLEDSIGISLFANDGSVKLKSMDVWQLKSIW